MLDVILAACSFKFVSVDLTYARVLNPYTWFGGSIICHQLLDDMWNIMEREDPIPLVYYLQGPCRVFFGLFRMRKTIYSDLNSHWDLFELNTTCPLKKLVPFIFNSRGWVKSRSKAIFGRRYQLKSKYIAKYILRLWYYSQDPVIDLGLIKDFHLFF